METPGFILIIVVLCVPPALAFGYCGKWMKREDTRSKRNRAFAIHLLVAILYSVLLLSQGSEEHYMDVGIPDIGGVVYFLIWLIISELHAVLFVFLAVNDIENDKKATRT